MVTDMTEQIDISIAVTVYNGIPYITGTLPELVGQLTHRMELILIDDGSVDGSSEFCRKLCEEHTHIRYVYQDNAGVVAARNRGLQEATGAYICFFDQDDYAWLQVYRKLCDRMKAEDAPMGMCSTAYGAPWNWFPYEQLRDDVFRAERVRNLACHLLLNGYEYPMQSENVFFYGTIWKCLFRRNWLLEKGLRFHAFKHYEDDLLFVLESLLQCSCVVGSSERGYGWYDNKESESHSRRYRENFLKRTLGYEKFMKELLTEKLPKEYSAVCLDAIYCNDLIDCLDNLYCAPRGKVYRRERREVCRLMKQRRADGSLQAAEHLKKNVLRRRVALQGIWRYGATWGIIMDRLACAIVRIGMGINIVRKMERRGKHNCQR